MRNFRKYNNKEMPTHKLSHDIRINENYYELVENHDKILFCYTSYFIFISTFVDFNK